MQIRSKFAKIRRNLLYKKNSLPRLRYNPRYEPGEFIIEDHTIFFPDAPSLGAMYEEIFLNHIYKFNTSNPCPTIIDCGANIGVSIIYFKCLFPESEIIAFEPDPLIYNYLCRNMQAFNYKNVTLINKGLWSEDTILEFHSEGADAGHIIRGENNAAGKNPEKIHVEKLSKYINNEIDFLKIDIEGAETEVIEEIEEKLVYINHIFIEYHSYTYNKQNLDRILQILTKNNFRYYIETSRLRDKPFVDKKTYHSMDLLLNLYAIKEK